MIIIIIIIVQPQSRKDVFWCSSYYCDCSNNIFPWTLIFTRMASSHIGITLQEIQKEQESIDKLIDSLLNTTTGTSSSGSVNADNKAINTPVLKKSRGRPSKSSVNSASSPVLRAASEKPSVDNIIECINKLNSQNRKLLECVQSLSDSVINGKCNSCPIAENSKNVGANNESTSAGLADRLDRIEQNINSNVLLCKGPGVSEVINQVRVGTSVNFERLKGNLCRAVCGDDIKEIDIKNLQVSIFGRERKSVRVDCGNSSSKLHIVRQARQRKPIGIYISEFLTKPKLEILRNLTSLKKLHPQKIKSVYTRDSNIFYRLQGADRAVLVKSVKEIENILKNVPATTVTPAEVAAIIPPVAVPVL